MFFNCLSFFINSLKTHRFCTFKLVTPEQLDVSRFESNRVLNLMKRLWTVQQRSYTNPYDSHYPVIRSKAAEPPLDRSAEAELRHFKMNGRTEYRAVYDREEYEEIVWSSDRHAIGLVSVRHCFSKVNKRHEIFKSDHANNNLIIQ